MTAYDEQTLLILLRAKHEGRSVWAVDFMNRLQRDDLQMALIAAVNLSYELMGEDVERMIEHWAETT